MNAANAVLTEFPLIPGAVLYSCPMGNLLVGCPPEILKTLMNQHVPMPDTIVVPHTTEKNFSSQVCLEFPFYHFLFIQQGLAQGKKLRVLAAQETCDYLKDMLRVTLLGPSYDEAIAAEKKIGIPEKLSKAKVKQVCNETSFLALKNKEGGILQVEDMVEFIPFEKGDSLPVYKGVFEEPDFILECKGMDSYLLHCGEDLACELNIDQPQEPAYAIKAKKVTAKEKKDENEFSVRLLGVSEGFDPRQPANGFLFHVQGKWVLWDCPVYLRSHLKQINLDFSEIDALFISHVHEDHLDVAQAIQEGAKTPLYTSPEIFHCLLIKLQAVKHCSYEEAKSYFDFHPVYADEPFDLFGATAEVFYSVHSIPALGLKLEAPVAGPESKQRGKIFISGDNLPFRAMEDLKAKNIFSKEREEGLTKLHKTLKDYDLIFVDAGGGMIHGDPEDYYDVKARVEYMHTGKPLEEGLPAKHEKVLQGTKFVLPLK